MDQQRPPAKVICSECKQEIAAYRGITIPEILALLYQHKAVCPALQQAERPGERQLIDGVGLGPDAQPVSNLQTQGPAYTPEDLMSLSDQTDSVLALDVGRMFSTVRILYSLVLRVVVNRPTHSCGECADCLAREAWAEALRGSTIYLERTFDKTVAQDRYKSYLGRNNMQN